MHNYKSLTSITQMVSNGDRSKNFLNLKLHGKNCKMNMFWVIHTKTEFTVFGFRQNVYEIEFYFQVFLEFRQPLYNFVYILINLPK